MATEREMLEGGGGRGVLVLHGKRKMPAARNLQEEEEEEEEAAEEEEREIEELEREIAELGRRVLDSRRTLPERLLQALSARLVALRPPSRRPALVDAVDTITAEMQPPSDLSEESLTTEADRMTHEKLQAFRAKIASNISSMPEVLKRTNECIAKIEKLEQHNLVIHPVFRKKRT